MARVTIDYGMDLGTTTCSSARLQGTEPLVIPNRDGANFTPSAVWIDKRGTVRVGRDAKERFAHDPANVDIEFKLRMRPELAQGPKRFPDSGATMTPAQLSAEMIKSIKADVQAHTGEDLRSLVITVPADFLAPQNMQTEEAARLAGIEFSPLLQEPVAAALAYGFQSASKGAYWMVYDFGGGTFDAAIVKVERDFVDVVEHAGDNYLGGKLIDWDIVDKYLAPRVAELPGMQGFRRDDPAMWEKHRVLFLVLKSFAESAKVEVSRYGRPYTILRESLVPGADGRLHDFEFVLEPAHVLATYQEYVTRSINLCKDALRRKNLAPSALEKVILVGGATLYPGLRDAVRSELGVALEFGIDPVTVVARGAAVYAATQRIPAAKADAAAPRPAGAFALQLEYDPVGTIDDPEVLGKLTAPAGVALAGFTLQVTEAGSRWNSGRVPVTREGAFAVVLHAEPGRRNDYSIELFDAKGTACAVEPARFPYTMGRPATGAQCSHDFGIANADNTVDVLFRKGLAIPNRIGTEHVTVRPIRARSADELRIPLLEGTHPRADRNTGIGALVISGADCASDLPAGSEVQITVVITESATLRASAYVPALDLDLKETVFDMRRAAPRIEDLEAKLAATIARHDEYASRAQKAEDTAALALLGRIARENLLDQARRHVATARVEPDHLPEAEQRLLGLMAALDEVEDALRWPDLEAAADAELQSAEKIVPKWGSAEEKARWKRFVTSIDAARAARDVEGLRTATRELGSLSVAVLLRQPGWWLAQLDELEGQVAEMRDPQAARQLVAQGRRAIAADDVEGLKAAVRQLWSLQQGDSSAIGSTPGAGGAGTQKKRG